MSTISRSSFVIPESKQFARAFAVSIAVRQGIPRRLALRLILTLSRVGILPFEDVEIIGVLKTYVKKKKWQ